MPETTSQPDRGEVLFEAALEGALSNLQATLTATVEALPEHPRKAPDLARALGLERNIAWKLFRLINERDVFAAARFVPGPASIAAFVTAGEAAGLPAPLLTRVTEAAQAYQEVVRRHAGDRVSADIMLVAKGGDSAGSGSAGGELRRGAFRAASYLAGVQAEAQLQAFIFAPAEGGAGEAGVFHGVSLNGFVNLRRMRPGAPVVIGRAMATDDRGNLLKPVNDGSIDGPLPEGEYVPLLKGFCSTPRPRFRQVQGDKGFIENELEEGPVGKTGAITFMAGTAIYAMASRYRDAQNANMDLVARVRTPTEVLICDILAHEAIFGDVTPRAAVYNDLFGSVLSRGPARERYRLPPSPRVVSLGKGVESAHTPEIPRYTKMLRHVMDRLGWDGERFNVYRVRIEFPFTPTSVVASFDLLEPPGR
jgi:hypothetical protein